MGWKLVEVPDEDETALTDCEVVGLNIILRQQVEEYSALGELSPWLHSWRKIQDVAKVAAKNWNS